MTTIEKTILENQMIIMAALTAVVVSVSGDLLANVTKSQLNRRINATQKVLSSDAQNAIK